GIDTLFEGFNTLCCTQDARLVLLEFGSNKAFRVDQRLLTQVVRWYKLEMGIAHFDIVAKDLVKANFERLNAGAFALAGLQGDHPALRVMDGCDKFVEFGMGTQANQPLIIVLFIFIHSSHEGTPN